MPTVPLESTLADCAEGLQTEYMKCNIKECAEVLSYIFCMQIFKVTCANSLNAAERSHLGAFTAPQLIGFGRFFSRGVDPYY